jgi:plastocyanin
MTMRLRTAVLGLATGVAVTLTACGNGPPPGQDTTSGGGGGGGGAETSVASGTAAQKVNETDTLTFTPGDVNIKVGDIVQWTNGGSATHNVTFSDGTASGDMGGNATYMVKFTKAGDYSYICTYHQPGMKGTVHVA